MKLKSLLYASMAMLSTSTIAQDLQPYFYKPLNLFGNPSSAKEYTYDYETQVESLAQNHSFKYNSNGKLIEHLKSNEEVSPSFYQNFRYRFQYDSKNRLNYYWNEAQGFNGYASEWEEQWVYDNFDMLVENSQWALSFGTKSLGYDSYKRIVSRNTNNQVTKIDTKEYSSFADSLVLEKTEEYKYKNNTIDTIIYWEKNVTLGGIMKIVEKKYNIVFKTYDDKNTDLIKFTSYASTDWDNKVYSTTYTYDASGRPTSVTEQSGSTTLVDTWVYEANKTSFIDNDYKKTETSFDASGKTVQEEIFYKSDNAWESDGVPYVRYVRTFDATKILTDLEENYRTANSAYFKATKYVFAYGGTVAVQDDLLQNQNLVYPNPTAGLIHIQNMEHVQGLKLTSSSGFTTSLPLSKSLELHQQAGFYILTIDYEDGSSQKVKVVVE